MLSWRGSSTHLFTPAELLEIKPTLIRKGGFVETIATTDKVIRTVMSRSGRKPDPELERFKPVSKRAGLTCALGPAHKWRPRGPCPPLAGPGQQHADVVLRVRVQVPQLVGDHVDGVHLGPGGLAGAVLDLFPDDGAVPQDGVGVQLDDQVRGAGAQQLRRRDGGWRHCEEKGNELSFFYPPPPHLKHAFNEVGEVPRQSGRRS